jgi:hypothetical protein
MRMIPWLVTFAAFAVAPLIGSPAFAQPSKPTAMALKGYHTASSEAEMALDEILRLSDKDDNMLNFVLRAPDYKPKADKGYAGHFTQRLLRDMAEMERREVKSKCGGKYIQGELCGTEYNPLTCAQDMSDSGYLYRTDSSGGSKATISYAWPGEKKRLAVFEMVLEHGRWMIDSVKCNPDK